MWRTPATENRYSFYQMYWVNQKSERTTEIKFPPCVGFEPTISWSIVQRVTTELSLLFGGKRYIESLSPVNGFEILISFLFVEMTYNQKWCSEYVSLLKPYENSAYSDCNTFYHFKVVIKAWHTEAWMNGKPFLVKVKLLWKTFIFHWRQRFILSNVSDWVECLYLSSTNYCLAG